MNRLANPFKIEVRFKGVDLTTKCVPSDRDVERGQAMSIRACPLNLTGQQNHTGARAERRRPVVNLCRQGFEQSAQLEKPRHRRRLSPRKN